MSISLPPVHASFGTPFDRLRREAQMKRSFQAALHILSPDAILLLGDVFDEGSVGWGWF
jgi:hypothetical protein